MSNAKITLYGFTRWMELNGKDLFEHLTLPAGIDKQLFTDNLMMEAGEFGVLYSDPELMANMIGVWGRKHYRTFDKWVSVLNKEYEPLYNLDVFEEWEDTGTLSGSKSGTKGINTTDTLTGSYDRTDGYTKSGTGEGSETSTGSETVGEDITDTVEETDTLDETDTNNLHSTTTGQTTTENTRSAFDTATYQPHDKSVVTASSTTDDTGTVSRESETVRNSETVRDRDQTTTTTGSTSNSNEYTETNAGTQTDEHTEERNIHVSGTDGENTNEATSGTHEGHRYGNQGVTMSQQMLQAELDVQRWNIYEHMTDLFIQDFCIAVYI